MAPGRLRVYASGLLRPPVSRILALAGWEVATGLPRPGDRIGVWGRGRTAWRGEAVARRFGLPLVRIEDAPLRGLFPGDPAPPAGLLIDETGLHFDAAAPSDVETLLATHPLDDPALLARARALAATLQRDHLAKYAATDPALPLPPAGYALVLDQRPGDAALRASGAGPARFRAMLAAARASGRRVVVKAHPSGLGHLADAADAADATVIRGPASPWALFAAAAEVHTVSSGAGFEAILAGHRPILHGTPAYAGWGLTRDPAPLPRRGRPLAPAQIAAALLILAPVWYDPFRDRLCSPEEAAEFLAARARAWREDRAGWAAPGLARWKRPHFRRFFGSVAPLRFAASPTRPTMIWGDRPGPPGAVRVEDGFLRSRGLGARLVPPVSLALDDLGLACDPARESRLERLIAEAAALPAADLARARRLRARLVALGLGKYGLGGAPLPPLPPGPRVLVLGQVEDDASIRLGAGAIRTNAALVAEARARRPGASVIFRPHPDVAAGLRRGGGPAACPRLASADLAALIDAADEVWTMTSTGGLEALLRGARVVVTGAPFYAGWGLTTDLGTPPARRRARPSLDALVHAALVAYPRYLDPVTGLACPVEVAVDRLAAGRVPRARGLLPLLQRLSATRA